MTTWTDAENGGSVFSDAETGGSDVTATGESLITASNASAALSALGVSAFAQTVLDDTTAADARTTLGAAGTAALAADSGSSLVGFLPSGSGANAESTQAALRRFVFAEQFDSFSEAVTAAASKTLIVNSSTAVASNVTVPATVTLRFERGGKLVPAASVTVTINGPVEAGLWQIFDISASGSAIAGTIKAPAYSPIWWGATGDGVADDTAEIQAAEDRAHATGIKLDFTGLATCLISSQLTFRAGSHDIDFAGCKFTTTGDETDFGSSTTAGYAVLFLPYSTTTNDRSSVTRIAGFYLEGPEDESNDLDGVYFGRGTLGGGALARTSFHNFTCVGFRDNVFFGDQTYIVGFFNPMILAAWRRNINADCQTVSGENLHFHGGAIANAVHSGGTAVDVYTPASSGADLNFHGTSFDYSDKIFDITNSRVSCFGCHFENDSDNPMGTVTHSSSFGSTLRICGGIISPTNSPSRTHLFEASGSRCSVEIDATIYLVSYKYEVVKVTSGFPKISVRGFADVTVSSTADTFPNLGSNLNQLYNADAELNATTGWSTSFVGTSAFSATSSEAHSGTYSFSLTGDGTAGISEAYQEIPVRPGELILASLWYKGTITAGSFQPQVQFLSSSGATITPAGVALRVGGLNQSASVADWARAGGFWVVPPGCTKVRLRVLVFGFNGTMYVDDLTLHVSA